MTSTASLIQTVDEGMTVIQCTNSCDASVQTSLSDTDVISALNWAEAFGVVITAVISILGNTSLFIVILDPRYKLQSTNNALVLCLSGKFTYNQALLFSQPTGIRTTDVNIS